jgi:hypothetical protein
MATAPMTAQAPATAYSTLWLPPPIVADRYPLQSGAAPAGPITTAIPTSW